ncbi:BNR repeat-containing protein [Sunxiuqinia indica]|uniref:BNR repeat-containing protein n=1 Tax=Sunxiuqinia indica TaxID=2692584 RepID=UPI00135C6622|nr:BNR repeat-containing protein [Sunxiuqinia indica]
MNFKTAASLFIILVMGLIMGCQSNVTETKKEFDKLVVDQIWSGCAANYDILTVPPHQFIAYYDSAKYMTVAQRKLGENTWIKKRLDTQVEWDAHNYITMVLDEEGCLHVSGNMHVVPLIYFQAEKPYDVTSLVKKESLIGNEEHAVTYPRFFKDHNGDLIFNYRTGSSGKGSQIYNRYQAESKKWSRLVEEPLINGEGKTNAYIEGPQLGPDGYFHMLWVWRENPDANTNTNLSYARSKDLIHWEKSDGSTQAIPITLANCDIVDPVPAQNGMLNGNIRIGFDSQNRVIASYHKYDENGNIQIYNARSENGKWKIYQATDWDWRWDFGGWGSIIARVGLSKVKLEGDQLTQKYYVDTVGQQRFVIDEANLKVIKQIEFKQNYPDSLTNLRWDSDLATVNILEDTSDEYGTYILRWETLRRNGDKGWDFIPESQPLELYHFEN